MFGSTNRAVLAAAVLLSASCVMGFPMLLGEPEMSDTGEMFSEKPVDSESGASAGSIEQQMQRALLSANPQIQTVSLMPSEEPVSAVQMQAEGSAMPQQASAEQSTEVQLAQQSPMVEPPKTETQSNQAGMPVVSDQSDGATISEQPDGAMMSDQPDGAMMSDQPMNVNQSQILSAPQVQETPMEQSSLCPPASDCPEKEMETPISPVQLTPPAASAEASQPEVKHLEVVMELDDKKTDKFEIPIAASPTA